MLSVYLEVAFSDFAFLGGGAGADMGLQGYKELSFDEAKAFLEKERRRKQQRSSRGRRGRGSSDYDTASSGDDN